MAETENGGKSEVAITKVVDAKFPITWLIGTAAAVISSYAVLYGDVGRLRTDVQELKITLKTQDSATTSLQGQMAITTFRLETAEAEIRRLSGGEDKRKGTK